MNVDSNLNPTQLAEKYKGPNDTWGAHPKFPRRDWRHEVAEESTQLGYWEWVESQIAQWDDENEPD